MALYHPDATRVPYADAGPYDPGFDPRLVHHTTEGVSLPRYSGSAPHMTVDVKRRKLYAHIRLDRTALALRGSDVAGIATNRARAIQIEWIGFSDGVAANRAGRPDLWVKNWTRADWAFIAGICRWVENNCGVAREDACSYENRAHPMSRARWRELEGHCGHQHVPGQTHWDPSGYWRKDLVLDLNGDPYRHLNLGDSGEDVRTFQRAVNRIARRCCRDDHLITVDGDCGPQTLKHGAWAVWLIGVGEDQEHVLEGGIGPKEQLWARDYDERPDSVKENGRARRGRHCRCKED
jgi:hypothetical protein